MKLKMGSVDFEISPVAGNMRGAILSDPGLASGIIRDVWSWNQPEGKAENVAELSQNGALPIPNGLAFFVAKKAGNGRLEKNDGPSRKMGDRFLEAVGAKNPNEVIIGVNKVLGISGTGLPLETFAALNDVASYKIQANTDYAVVQLRDAGRNLTAYLMMPGQIVFRHVLGDISDQAGYDALIKKSPELATAMPAYILHPRSKPGLDMRRIALVQRAAELQGLINHLTGEGKDEDVLRLPKAELTRLSAEAKLLAPRPGEPGGPPANVPGSPAIG
ncbi:MAG: hypothetical protein JKX69_09050 [Rhodobacteraceae bacterium]|nr:hypothetical protein [Paracoccaceae bacterium]